MWINRCSDRCSESDLGAVVSARSRLPSVVAAFETERVMAESALAVAIATKHSSRSQSSSG